MYAPLHGHPSEDGRPAPHPRRSTRCRLLLLADLDPDSHGMYGDSLELAGYRLVHAHSALQCLRARRRLRLSAAVVSVGRRGVLGREEYTEFVAAGEPCAIVCITTDPCFAGHAQSLLSGSAAVLMLPCTPPELVEQVARAVRAAEGLPN